MQRRLWLLSLLLTTLIGCQPIRLDVPPTSLPTPLAPESTLTSVPLFPTGVATPTPHIADSPSGTDISTLTQYYLTAALNYPGRQLAVTEDVIYVNSSNSTLTELVFVVEPLRTEGVFQLERLAWQDGTSIEAFTLQDAALSVPLQSDLLPGGKVGMTLRFNLHIPDRVAPLGASRRMMTLTDWYPFVAHLNEAGEFQVAHPNPAGEYLTYDQADIHLSLYLSQPEGLQVVGAGLTSFSGGLAEFDLPAGRTLALAVTDTMEVITSTEEELTVHAMIFPEHHDAGMAAIANTFSAVRVFSDKYGDYPRSTLALVEVGFPDGLESDGLFFIGSEYFASYDGRVDNYLTMISVHETAHQWWFAQVGNDPVQDAWLDEALCTYSEYIWYQELHPELGEWWWRNRVWWYAPLGDVGAPTSIYEGFRPYVNAVYLRGASFLHALHMKLGDAAFFAFVRAYLTEMRGGIATSADFWRILEQNTPSSEWEGLRQSYFGTE